MGWPQIHTDETQIHGKNRASANPGFEESRQERRVPARTAFPAFLIQNLCFICAHPWLKNPIRNENRPRPTRLLGDRRRGGVPETLCASAGGTRTRVRAVRVGGVAPRRVAARRVARGRWKIAARVCRRV